MTLYQKILSVFGLLRASIGLRADREELAPRFDAARTYTQGRLVVYDNALYRCVAQHTGAWDANHFTPTTIDAAISYNGDVANCVKKDDVVPVEIKDGVKIATIGGKEIKAPSGGGLCCAEYGYPLVNITPAASGGILEAHVADYTISNITVTDSTPLKIVLPANNTGRGLHLIVRVEVNRIDSPPDIVFVPPTDDIGFESSRADWMTLDLGVNMFTFTGVTNA